MFTLVVFFALVASVIALRVKSRADLSTSDAARVVESTFVGDAVAGDPIIPPKCGSVGKNGKTLFPKDHTCPAGTKKTVCREKSGGKNVEKSFCE